MVFFQQQLERTIVVHPMWLGPKLRDHVRKQLTEEVEGLPLSSAGFVITVLAIEDENISKGLVDSLTGFVKYRVSFSALVFRPFRNEVLDAVVTSVSDIGFFAAAGPLSVLVSTAHIPEDMSFTPEDGSFNSPETGTRIAAGDAVRVKIVGSTVMRSTLTAIGSIKEPYLGLLA